METELLSRFQNIDFNITEPEQLYKQAFEAGKTASPTCFYKLTPTSQELLLKYEQTLHYVMIKHFDQSVIFDFNTSTRIRTVEALKDNECKVLYQFCLGVIHSNFMQITDFDILLDLIFSKYWNTWRWLISQKCTY